MYDNENVIYKCNLPLFISLMGDITKHAAEQSVDIHMHVAYIKRCTLYLLKDKKQLSAD